MAKHVTARDPYRFTARTLRKQLNKLVEQMHGVKHSEDAEYVHKLRVAGRHVRNSLKLFADFLPDKPRKRWNKAIHRMASRLGVIRDLDVQIIAAERYLKDMRQAEPAMRKGVERLLLRLRQDRQALREKADKAVDRLGKGNAIPQMRQALKEIGDRPAADEQEVARFRQVVKETLNQRLDELLAYDEAVRNERDIESLHAMRIAAKHLRYTMEAYQPLIGKAFKPHIKLAKRVQTVLGDTHDCDVWIDFLPRFIEEERARHKEFHGHARGYVSITRGLQAMRDYWQRRRRRLYESFMESWARREPQQWQRMRHDFEMASPPLRPDVEQTPGAPPQTPEPTSAEPETDAQPHRFHSSHDPCWN